MQRLSSLSFIVSLVVFATLFMFLMIVIVEVLGASAWIVVYLICIPLVVALVIFGLILLTLALTDVLHFYTTKWRHRESQYQTRRNEQ
jgi:hypothetical protein